MDFDLCVYLCEAASCYELVKRVVSLRTEKIRLG